MKVLLKQPIPKLGERDDIVDVKDGYARNFLFPQGLAEIATGAIIQQGEERRVQREKEEIERRAKIEAALKKLEGARVEISASADDDGTLYAAVSEDAVAQALQEQGFDVTVRDVVFTEPIKKKGEHTVLLDFGENVTATIMVVVEQEKKE